MLKYHWRGNREEEGGGFCYLPSLETERWFPLPCLWAPAEWQPQVGFLTGSGGAPSGGVRAGFPCAAPPGVWGAVLGVCCTWYLLLSLPPDSWRLMQLISVCCCWCLTLRGGPSPGKRKRKMMGAVRSGICPGLGMPDSSQMPGGAGSALPPGKSVTSGTQMVDMETKIQ